jgi:thermostable 8-oxoguanine DNA glycosylase
MTIVWIIAIVHGLLAVTATVGWIMALRIIREIAETSDEDLPAVMRVIRYRFARKQPRV